MLEVIRMQLTPFQQNTRILACSKSSEAVIIDPGGESEILLAELKKLGLTLKQIWLTHSHLDHCGGVKSILEQHAVDLIAHPDERFMRENVVNVAAMYGIGPGIFDNCPEPNIYIKGGEELVFSEYTFKVLFTPGHSPGHVSLYCAQEGFVVAGDVLFAGSIGRTDLPGGNHEQLIQSVRDKLFTLPLNTRVLSGHGEDTTIGHEMTHNPFFNGMM